MPENQNHRLQLSIVMELMYYFFKKRIRQNSCLSYSGGLRFGFYESRIYYYSYLLLNIPNFLYFLTVFRTKNRQCIWFEGNIDKIVTYREIWRQKLSSLVNCQLFTCFIWVFFSKSVFQPVMNCTCKVKTVPTCNPIEPKLTCNDFGNRIADS